MPITLYEPFSFSHVGQRAVNQDAVYPAAGQATAQDQLFLVCDGIGGADKGEVASQLLCEAIVTYCQRMGNPPLNAVHLQSALDTAHEAYRAYLNQHPLVSRMGTTLALLQLTDHGALIAHLGDSRVYHIRHGAVLFQTSDHKQVNDLVEAGIITAEQARSHPWRNRLSRAFIGQNAGPPPPVRADCQFIGDVQAGDYFFLCSDGALERLDDYMLTEVLAGNLPDQTKLQTLLDRCAGQTKDNYSGHLVHVRAVDVPQPVMPHTLSTAGV